MQFELTYHPDTVVIDQIYAGLDTFNETQFYDAEEHPFACLVRNETGQLTAGLYGRRFYQAMHVKYLWVAQELRSGGVGRTLMQMAEEEARAHQVAAMFVDTYTFQAPDFYHKLGFIEVGRYRNFPKPGVDKIFLQKTLS